MSSEIFQVIGGLGIISAMLTLYKINHDKIERTRDNFHDVDKKLAVLMSVLEIKWGKDIIKEAQKKNGNETVN